MHAALGVAKSEQVSGAFLFQTLATRGGDHFSIHLLTLYVETIYWTHWHFRLYLIRMLRGMLIQVMSYCNKFLFTQIENAA